MPRLGVVAAPVLAMGLVLAARASAQSTASAQAGAGTVRFPGGATTSVFSISPDLSDVGPSHQVSFGGTLASVPQSSGYGQLRFAAWLTTTSATGRWHLASDLGLSGTRLGGGGASAAGSITGEVTYVARHWGAALGAGPISGWVNDSGYSRIVTALHTRLRGWWSDGPSSTTITGSIEPTQFLGSWYTDINATVMQRHGRFTTQVTAAGRISSAYVSRAAALAAVEVRLTPAWSFNVVGGNVLPDPFQGFPATGVVLAGVRFQVPLHRSTTRQVVHGSGFMVTRSADGVTLEFEHRGAQSVSIVGDWNSWLPSPLAATRPGRWEVHLTLSPGVYHFTLLVDGSAWAIPPGVPNVPDGLGGRVAVLVVTP